jgi:hypothetical protein
LVGSYQNSRTSIFLNFSTMETTIFPSETTISEGDTHCDLLPSDINLEEVLRVINLEEVHWTDVDIDEDGNATGVLGSEFKELSSKQLRTICSRLNLKGVKNVKKQDMVDRLIIAHKNWNNYKTLQNRKQDTAPRKQVQCSFRLLNILFSDEFATPFASLGDAATRQSLDIGTAGNDEAFWVEVQKAFVTYHENYDVLLFHDAIFSSIEINPGDIVHHDWKKLRSIWKALNAEYKATLTRYTISGTHESDFYDFCNGKLDVYYLRKHLEQRPNLNGTVEADLPEECALSSDKLFSPTKTSTTEGSNKGDSNEKKKRKSADNADIASAIRDFGNSKMRAELAMHKIDYMQKEDARQQTTHQQQQHNMLFDEWEKVQSNIRLLRKDLQEANIDSTTSADLEEDINGLIKRKNELASLLGLK